ncbi:MAG: glycosyltransferase [Candidatus Thorarchaeota archaeon]
MRILFASHKGLPDHRIERAAQVARAAGHTVTFLGLGTTRQPLLNVFESLTMLRSINNRQAALDQRIRMEWADAVRQIDPDLVHASNIIAAHFTDRLDMPMVYDDHEYWSAQRIVYQNWPAWKRLAIRPFLESIPRWEREIVSRHVTITVSEPIAAEHRRYGPNVFVLPNYSSLVEVKDLPVNPQRVGIAYVGDDFVRPRFSPHRDMTGLREHVSFDDFHGLPRDELYRRLTRYKFGLVPFRDSAYSRYIACSKTFDYLNCGLQVLMTRTLYESHGRLPFTHAFDSYDEIEPLTRRLPHVDPAEIMHYAHENLVWEAQSDKLLAAYELELQLHGAGRGQR